MKIKPKPSLILWIFICVFLVVWLGFDLWSGISKGEIKDLRTGNSLLLDNRPVWFSIVFALKSLAIAACLYFLYGASQIAGVIFKKAKRKKEPEFNLQSHHSVQT